MSALQDEIAAYERARAELEQRHKGEWAVFHAGELLGVFGAFQDAASKATDQFGSGPYLIRQIGIESIPLSSTMMFTPSHANSASGL